MKKNQQKSDVKPAAPEAAVDTFLPDLSVPNKAEHPVIADADIPGEASIQNLVSEADSELKDSGVRTIGARVSPALYDHFVHQCGIHCCSPSDAIRTLVKNWGPEVSLTCADCGCKIRILLDESQPIRDLYAAYRCPKCGSSNCTRTAR